MRPAIPLTVNVDTLALELPFRDPAHGRALAGAVMRELGRMPPLPDLRAPARLPGLRVSLPAFARGTPDAQVARVTAGAIHRALTGAIRQSSQPKVR